MSVAFGRQGGSWVVLFDCLFHYKITIIFYTAIGKLYNFFVSGAECWWAEPWGLSKRRESRLFVIDADKMDHSSVSW